MVGGGEGEFTENEEGDWRQLEEAGDKLELFGVPVSQYLQSRRPIIPTLSSFQLDRRETYLDRSFPVNMVKLGHNKVKI